MGRLARVPARAFPQDRESWLGLARREGRPRTPTRIAEQRCSIPARRQLRLARLTQQILQFELARNLIAVENSYRTEVRRAGLFEKLEKTITRSFYEDEEDATQRALQLSLALGETDEDYAAQDPQIQPLDPQGQLIEEVAD